ncbi:MAG: glucosamine-6-phosphate deaminase [Planctomycetes bacterium]|nr:glucosamine-6-phosphate deaminase [Planctomycetota bacterium]
MRITITDTPLHLGQAAASKAIAHIETALAARGKANIIVATGASQFATLDHLTKSMSIDWSRVTGFHLDEYLGLPMSHPASFRGYLKHRFVDRVPLAAFHYINGDASDPLAECERAGKLLRAHPIDVALVGIGENAHLAFNDPPANFDTDEPYIIVDLDEACRKQQLGEGWFPTLADVPTRAISMSVTWIMKAAAIVCSVPDERKAEAVQRSVEGPVSPRTPASILQRHANLDLYLDRAAASRLTKRQ